MLALIHYYPNNFVKSMKILNTYEDREEAEVAFMAISGEKRLASERDSTLVIYNLFGQPTWNNFYKLNMFRLEELKNIIHCHEHNLFYNRDEYIKIIDTVRYAEKYFEIKIPQHWII